MGARANSDRSAHRSRPKKGLQGKELLGDELLLPSVMLRQDEKIFLDDMTLQELSSSLNVPIRIVHGAHDIVNKALGKA